MNYARIVFGGLIAGVIYFVGDGIVHGALLHSQWVQILGPNADQSLHQPAYFGPYDLLKGLLAVWIYAAIRPRFHPGPGIAALAGVLVWFACIPVPLLGLLPMNFFGSGFAVRWMIYSLIPMVVGSLAGASIYKETA